jgi:hypothetical protein
MLLADVYFLMFQFTSFEDLNSKKPEQMMNAVLLPLFDPPAAFS